MVDGSYVAESPGGAGGGPGVEVGGGAGGTSRAALDQPSDLTWHRPAHLTYAVKCSVKARRWRAGVMVGARFRFGLRFGLKLQDWRRCWEHQVKVSL